MSGTAFWFAAYDGGMETLVLLFLLVALEKDPSLKDALKGFLGFYKENRELISTVLGAASPEASPETAAEASKTAEAPAHTAGKQESRPQTKVGSLNILEEYLKRCEI